jgi:hypothetical protein
MLFRGRQLWALIRGSIISLPTVIYIGLLRTNSVLPFLITFHVSSSNGSLVIYMDPRVKLCRISCDLRVFYFLQKCGLHFSIFSSAPNFRTLQKVMHSVRWCDKLQDLENDLRALEVKRWRQKTTENMSHCQRRACYRGQVSRGLKQASIVSFGWNSFRRSDNADVSL